ncbi:MAG: transcription-repair coupling factor [Deltaproteobacteria bacterium]|nr:transcription-repair coupling factor [Deltaproteobacteria bacterium]
MAAGREVLVGGVEGSARAFALARLWLASPATTLVVCPTLALAESLNRDLEFFLGGEDDRPAPVRLFPAYEVSPYRELDPPAEIIARRLAVMWELIALEEPLIVVTSAGALTCRLCPPERLVDGSLALAAGAELERDKLVQALLEGGYTTVSVVEQVGEFAVRGSVVDYFGPLLEEPVRVEFFGDEVESLRTFDPADQRSLVKLAAAQMIPCHPVDLSPAAVERAVAQIRDIAREEKLSTRRLAELTEQMERRVVFPGLESLLSLYSAQAADLFSYLPVGCRRVLLEPAETEELLRTEAKELAAEFEAARDQGRIVLAPPYQRRTPDQIRLRLADGPRLAFRALALSPQGWEESGWVRLQADSWSGLYQDLARAGGKGSVLTAFLAWVAERAEEGRATVLVCRSRSQIDRLTELFAEREIPAAVAASARQTWPPPADGRLTLLVGGLLHGFAPADLPLCLVTEDEVFGAPRVVRQKAPPKLSAMLAALDDLVPGDLVVHVDHGVGQYLGLKSMAVGPAESDFLEIVYHGGDRLYLPADRMGLITKYRGPGDAKPSLDRLGGKVWARTKGRVKKAVEEIAQDLVELYATRRVHKGHVYHAPDRAYREFELGFPYSETPDQARSISEVIEDLTSPRPMDRLVCGDVGFGKTEVALRAAFLVASQGRQVAVLVPTTVLAEQHFQTFLERLKDTPLVVDSLSRFKTAAQQKKVLAALAKGGVDILIGTHRLLSQDVVFANLGLLVVDEEQRFGVRDKEKLKQLRRLVDVLTLTATPIPRTMQLSLSGIRDLSVINTPPEDRMAIKTYMSTFSPQSVKEAIERELRRGGQVFFVHNRVQDIGKMAAMIKALAPQARVGVAHGQLSEKSLERVMLAFVRRELDVLVATTIIESGLDIPSANTIVINNADKLGLSQIYQLRGRVGRSNQRAYAYLFIKSETALSRDAKKRLKALMDFTSLGAGFAIAMHDLEIRGAGNLLGEAQSGVAAEVGYELYLAMLEEAIARLKGEAPPEGPEPELNLALAAQLPEDYVPDAEVRLGVYRRLSAVRQAEDLEQIGRELADRFGPAPAPVRNLLDAVDLKRLLRQLGAHRLDLAAGSLTAHFGESHHLDMARLMQIAQDPRRGVKVFPEGRIHVRLGQGESPLAAARNFLHELGAGAN